MLYFPILLLLFAYIVNAQNKVSVGSPVANQTLTPGKNVPIQYTILGTTSNSSNNVNPLSGSYPSSMDLVFRWQATNNNSQKPMEFSARTHLPIDPFPGGIKDQTYHQYWKAPSQKFFDRYSTTQWNFFLVFQPKYPGSPILNTNATSNQIPQQQQQKDEISIPLNVQPSITKNQNGHHKKETKGSAL